MRTSISMLLVAAALAAPASAQQVLFHDGFEGGLSSWTATGLWNLEASTDACGSQAAPFPEAAHAAWYGVDGACNYDTMGANSGSLELTSFLNLPSNVGSISLRFWSFSETEYCANGFDIHSVRVIAQNGPDGGFTAPMCATQFLSGLSLPWHERRVDLTAYAGAQVQFAFDFATVDDLSNSTLGWLIDDVSIQIEPGQRVCPSGGLDSGCPCMAPSVPAAGGCRNSTGQSATLLSQGVASVAQDTLQFTALHMPPGTTATLFQGSTPPNAVLFGDGIRCVGGTTMRLGSHAAQGGSTLWPAPGSASLSTLGSLPPGGATRYYQVIYRDAAMFCQAATFNLTDAQRIVWSP